MLCAKGSLLLGFLLVASQSFASVPDTGESHIIVSIVDDGRAYTYRKGSGTYRVAFNYTGENWTHADVAAIKIATRQPIAILPMQYTEPGGMQPGAIVYEKNIGKRWNTITQAAMAERLRDRGFFVLTPSITHYGENLPGFQALEHFIAGVHKGNNNVQTVVLTADADIANPQNPTPGAQMLVTGTNPRDREWESLIQNHILPFYEAVSLGNIGPRVRGGLSDKEGASAAWHPLVERAAEYGPCLLYTSPSPRDLSTSRMPSSA